MVTRDLERSNNNLSVRGKLIVYLSTNVDRSDSLNPGPSRVSGTTEALSLMDVDSPTPFSSTSGGNPSD